MGRPSRLVLGKKFFWIWFIYALKGIVLALQFFFDKVSHLKHPTEQCLGIETHFTTVGKTWCSARSLLLITTHASNLSLNLLLKKSTFSFSVTQAHVMIIRGFITLRMLKRAVLVTHFFDLAILCNKHV